MENDGNFIPRVRKLFAIREMKRLLEKKKYDSRANGCDAYVRPVLFAISTVRIMNTERLIARDYRGPFGLRAVVERMAHREFPVENRFTSEKKTKKKSLGTITDWSTSK